MSFGTFIKPMRTAILQEQQGFSLVEVLVALSLLSIVGLGFGTMMSENFKQMAYVEDKNSMHQLSTEIQRILTDGTSCKSAFGSTRLPAPNGKANVSIYDNGKVRFARTGNSSKYDKLNIGNIQVTNVDASLARRVGRMKVTVNVERQRSGGGPKVIKPLEQTIRVAINGSTNPQNPYGLTACEDEKKPVMVQGTMGDTMDISREEEWHSFANVTFVRKAAPAQINASVNVGGGRSDLWYAVKVTKSINGGEDKHVYGWPDGTGYRGAATQSSGAFVDNEETFGVATYKIWVKKMGDNAPVRGSYIQLNHSRLSITQP